MKSWGAESCGDPCLSGHCFTHPGCWVKVPFCCCSKPKGTIATPCSGSWPALLAAGFPEGPPWWSWVKSWKVSLSVSSPQRRMWGVCVREREREGGFPPVSGGCGPRVSCFLISTSILFILSPSQIRKDSQEVAQAAEGGSGQGMNVCVCVCQKERCYSGEFTVTMAWAVLFCSPQGR